MKPSYAKVIAAVKPTSLKHAIGLVLILTGITYMGVSQYTKHQIQGSWKCNAGDGRLAGVFEFSDDSYYLETHRTGQYFGVYDVDWKTIKTSITGAMIGNINADKKNPVKAEINFIKKSNGNLILYIWPASHPMGVSVFCQDWRNS